MIRHLAVLILIVPATCMAQSAPTQQPSARTLSNKELTQAAKEKPRLLDLTLVSTSAAAHKAAEDAARRKQTAKENPNPSNSDAVLEFHTASPGAPLKSSQVAADGEKSSRSALKDIHGTLYGTTGQAGQVAGGNAGASMRDGKLNIYIESQRSKTSNSAPH